MNNYKVIKSTVPEFNGKTFTCDCSEITKEKIENILERKFRFLEIKQENGLFIIQNEHFTLIIQEVNN
jgi:hypothetical protein